MTKKASAAPPQGARFDPARMYRVQLSQAVEWPPGSRRFLSPGKENELRGDVAEALKDAIAHAEPV